MNVIYPHGFRSFDKELIIDGLSSKVCQSYEKMSCDPVFKYCLSSGRTSSYSYQGVFGDVFETLY